MTRAGLVAVFLVVFASGVASGATYEVGPGQPYAAIGDVPLESLQAGDLVLIHWRDTPYLEKFVLGNDGTQAAPIIVRGVLGPGGERPVIDGAGAVTRTQLDYWNQVRAVVKIGGSNSPADDPSYIVIENLDVGGGRPGNFFTDSNGASLEYADNAAAIWIENGAHVTIRNCVIRDSSNGFFASSGASDVLVEGNWIHDNGNVGDIYVHNNYTEANGITFQYNHFAPLCAGCSGNNLKDRSAGLVVRYNWIEGGNRQLDLVDSDLFFALPAYATTWVYGNVLVEPDGDGNRQVVHYGGDSGDEAIYRKGTLHFYNNTVVSRRTDRTTLFRLSSAGESADARNNILYTTAGGDTWALLDADGDLSWGHNWIKPGWVDSFGGITGTITDQGGNVEGAEPGFIAEGGDDFQLRIDSPAREAAGPLAMGAPPLTEQYVPHQTAVARPAEGLLDIGAFEFCGAPFCSQPPVHDGGPGGAADAGGSPGADSGPGVEGDDSGCGCQAGGRPAGRLGLMLLVVGLGLALRRRRAD